MEYIGKNGRYSLASQPMKQGGEGAIYSVTGRNDLVAKIYFKDRVSAELSEKLSFMANNPPDSSILSQIAWPQDVLRDANGNFVGFVMPKLKIDADLKDIYVYPPKKDLQITYEQKIIIAINICIVISAIHKAGYTFGDFNPLNIGVNLTTGHVAFLDTDSYHIYDKYSRKMYRCGVCLDGYVAPELIKQCKGTDYLSAPLPTFTQETDKFALAIHIFKLLMNGFTPFNGIKETDSVSQASPGRGNQAIEKDNYCFKAGNKPQSVATPDLSAFPPDIQYLFKRAFIDGRENPEDRPSADEWYKALLDYKKNLVQCKRDKTHFYYVNDRECPYCAAEERYNLSLGKNSGSNQMTFSQPISVPNTSASNARSYKPTSASSPGVSGSNKTSYLGSSGYQTTFTKQKKGNFKKKLIIGCIVSVVLLALIVAMCFYYKTITKEQATTVGCIAAAVIATIIWVGMLISGEKSGCGTWIVSYLIAGVILVLISLGVWHLVHINDDPIIVNGEEVESNVLQSITLNIDKTNATIGDTVKLSFTPNPTNPEKALVGKDEERTYDELCIEYYVRINGETKKLSSRRATIEYKLEQMGEFVFWAKYCQHSNCDGTYDIVSKEIKVTVKGNTISSASDLNKLRNSSDNFEFTCDIDMSGLSFIPIEGFSGTLDGKGYKIKNLTINTSASNVGFFSTLNGAVTNLIFENASVTVSGSNENIGILCGTLNGSANTINVSGIVNAEKSKFVGGIIGFSANIREIFDLQFIGDVNALQYVGGIVGYACYGSISEAVVSAKLSGDAYIGGVGGYLSCVTINSCKNTGSSINANKYAIIDGIKYAYVGGYAGYGYDAIDCTNEIDINYSAGGRYVGGIFGYQENNSSKEDRDNKNLINKADISGNDYVGGIVGYSAMNSLSGTNWMSENATISGHDYVGGLIGYANGIKELADMQVTGNIAGEMYVGGVAGKAQFGNICEAKTSVNLSAKAYIGCIAGELYRTTIFDCQNDGSMISANSYVSIDGIKYAYIGGFVGSGYVAQNCTNKVNINYSGGGKYVGGIMGCSSGCYENQTLDFVNLGNDASIVGSECVGGIIGAFNYIIKDGWYYTNKYSFTDLKNTGKVIGNGNYVGGIFGYFYIYLDCGNSWVYITDANNSGDISGDEYVGGIVGYLAKSGNSSFNGTGAASGIFDPKATGKVTGNANYGDIVGKSDIPVQ